MNECEMRDYLHDHSECWCPYKSCAKDELVKPCPHSIAVWLYAEKAAENKRLEGKVGELSQRCAWAELCLAISQNDCDKKTKALELVAYHPSQDCLYPMPDVDVEMGNLAKEGFQK